MSDLNNETTMDVVGADNDNDVSTLENVVVGVKNENDHDQSEASTLKNVVGDNNENGQPEASALENVVGVKHENNQPEASTLENVVEVNSENDQPEASILENVVGVNNENDQPEASTFENVVVGVNNENDQLEASTLENFVVGVNNENDQPEASTPEKRKREWKLRSVAWEHFTKLINDDGIYDKCQCIHCNKLFSHTGGTTHLLRHIRDGSCPEYNKEKTDLPDLPSVTRKKKVKKLNQQTMHPDQEILPVSCYDGECDQATEAFEDKFGGQSHTPVWRKRPNKSRGESSSWMNELRGCVGRLVDLTSVQNGSGPVMASDYSIATAIRFLNEMEDIPQSSEMYLDALELLKNGGERECFICLPQEPRRRWLQRMLHRNYPLRYDYDF